MKDVTTGVARTETSGSVSSAVVNSTFSTLGAIYNHFANVHGWVSLDDNDRQIEADVNDPGRINNATYNWSTNKLRFGPGMAEPDIIGHEFMHGVTRWTANLWYVNMSGALSESYSDIFGSRFDNNWLIGESSAIGTIRSMSSPASLGPHWLTGRPLPDTLSKFARGDVY